MSKKTNDVNTELTNVNQEPTVYENNKVDKKESNVEKPKDTNPQELKPQGKDNNEPNQKDTDQKDEDPIEQYIDVKNRVSNRTMIPAIKGCIKNERILRLLFNYFPGTYISSIKYLQQDEQLIAVSIVREMIPDYKLPIKVNKNDEKVKQLKDKLHDLLQSNKDKNEIVNFIMENNRSIIKVLVLELVNR